MIATFFTNSSYIVYNPVGYCQSDQSGFKGNKMITYYDR